MFYNTDYDNNKALFIVTSIIPIKQPQNVGDYFFLF